MTPIRIVVLLGLAVVQAACSRPAESPVAASTPKKVEHHVLETGNISEDQALALLLSELKARKTADLDCLSFQNEGEPGSDSKAELWEFAAREIHNERCGGDPEVSHVRDRYKVSSANKVWVYDIVEDNYKLL